MKKERKNRGNRFFLEPRHEETMVVALGRNQPFLALVV